MKEVLRDAGIPTRAVDRRDQRGRGARIRRRRSATRSSSSRAPPPAPRARCASTSDAELDARSPTSARRGASDVAVEEFIEGHEGFYDTISIDGRPRYDFISHYYPNVLEAMRERWISPQFIATNRIDTTPDYDEVRELGLRAIEALGIGTSATHMEWFFGPKGLRFSEIGCRPPGVRAWDLYAAGNDIDIYREWANAIVHGTRRARRSRAASPRGSSRSAPIATATITHYDGRRGGAAPVRRVDHRQPPARPTARRRSRSKPGTWRTRGSAWHIPTTTPSTTCSTSSARRSTCAPREAGDPARATRRGSIWQRRSQAFGVDGPVALITAGWEEGERNDADIDRRLGGGSRNLGLYGRRLDVLEQRRRSTPTRSGCCARQLDELREVYLLRLRHALDGVDVIRRHVSPRQSAGQASELDAAIDAVRTLDEAHVSRDRRRVRRGSTHRIRRTSAPAIAGHRDEVAAIVAGCAAIAIAGGHVGVLNDCLHLCNLAALIEERPLLAWSSGMHGRLRADRGRRR